MILGRMRKKPCKQIGRKFHAVKPPSRIKQKLVRESSRLPLDYNFCFFFFFFHSNWKTEEFSCPLNQNPGDFRLCRIISMHLWTWILMRTSGIRDRLSLRNISHRFAKIQITSISHFYHVSINHIYGQKRWRTKKHGW